MSETPRPMKEIADDAGLQEMGDMIYGHRLKFINDFLWFQRIFARNKAQRGAVNKMHDSMWEFFDAVESVHFRLVGVMADMLRALEEPENDGKVWSDDEIERAVNWRADGQSIDWIANTLRRTSQSVAAKISREVGIRQIEVQIKGFIEGLLDGHHEEGHFTGSLRREA